MPIEDERYDVALPNLVSKKAYSLKQLEVLIQEALEHPGHASALIKKSRDKVFGTWVGPKPWKESMHIMIDCINDKYEEIIGQRRKLARIEFFMKVLKRKFLDYRYVSKKLKNDRREYYEHKGNKISVSEIEDIIGTEDFKIKKSNFDWYIIWK